MFVCLSVCLSVCVFVCLCVCVFVCSCMRERERERERESYCVFVCVWKSGGKEGSEGRVAKTRIRVKRNAQSKPESPDQSSTRVYAPSPTHALAHTSIIDFAIRSLLEPPGFTNSSFASTTVDSSMDICACVYGGARESLRACMCCAHATSIQEHGRAYG